MSFDPFLPQAILRTRLLSDATLTAAVQGVWNEVAPDDIELDRGADPIVIITNVSLGFDFTTFQTNIADTDYQVAVWDHRVNGVVPARTVLSRVFGNSKGTDNEPTYGLARWKITGVTGMADVTVEPLSGGILNDGEGHHGYYLTFRVLVQEA